MTIDEWKLILLLWKKMNHSWVVPESFFLFFNLFLYIRCKVKISFFNLPIFLTSTYLVKFKEIGRVFQNYSNLICRTIIQHEIRNCFSPTGHRLILSTFFKIFFVAKWFGREPCKIYNQIEYFMLSHWICPNLHFYDTFFNLYVFKKCKVTTLAW